MSLRVVVVFFKTKKNIYKIAEGGESLNKGPVKLMKRVKIAHSFLQAVSYQFHVIVLSLPM